MAVFGSVLAAHGQRGDIKSKSLRNARHRGCVLERSEVPFYNYIVYITINPRVSRLVCLIYMGESLDTEVVLILRKSWDTAAIPFL